MVNNPIPEVLKSDHLFMLVGTNPLPDWVAARLLLKDKGKLYLLRSIRTLEASQRLAQFAMAKGYPRPAQIDVGNDVDDPYKPERICKAISKELKQIGSGSIGFNYTGGTKVMAVHGYRTLETETPVGIPPIVFSYLQAGTCVMRFDAHSQYCPTGAEYKVGLVDDVCLSFRELLDLHDDIELGEFEREPLAETVFKLLVDIHSDKRRQEAWWEECRKFSHAISLFEDFPKIAEVLISNGSPVAKRLGDVVQVHKLGFKSAEELANWLRGLWLEHYVLSHLKEQSTEYLIHDYCRNLKPQRIYAAFDPTEIEVDVGAMRGYQLHLISCYSGSEKMRCKSKLFEVLTRARQMGGEAARAALVCCSDDPQAVEADVGEVWDLKDQVKVFGFFGNRCKTPPYLVPQ